MELSCPSLTDVNIMVQIDWRVDLWYGLQRAVRKFAEWTKGRMDVMSKFLEDIEFTTALADLQLPEEAKVKLIAFSATCNIHYKIF